MIAAIMDRHTNIHLDDNQRNTTAKFAFKCFSGYRK